MIFIWEYYYIKVFNLRHKLGFNELNEPFMSLLAVCMIDGFVLVQNQFCSNRCSIA